MKIVAIVLMILGVGVWIIVAVVKLIPSNLPKNIQTSSSTASNKIAQIQPRQVESPPVIQPNIANSSLVPTDIATNAGQASPTPPSQATSPGNPMTLDIPKIGLLAAIESVGLDSESRMDVPKAWNNVGWYNLGYRIGDMGSAVIAGHYDTVGGAPAAFYQIGSLSPGDIITVLDDAGKSYNFKVTKKETYPWDSLPLPTIFGDASSRKLNLITCGGSWDKLSHNYTQRVVIYSELQ